MENQDIKPPIVCWEMILAGDIKLMEIETAAQSRLTNGTVDLNKLQASLTPEAFRRYISLLREVRGAKQAVKALESPA